MEWIGGLIIGALCGWWLRSRLAVSELAKADWNTSLARETVNEAEDRYLGVLRRELMNLLYCGGADAVVLAFNRARTYREEMAAASKERIEAEFRILCLKYPRYADFDLLGIKHFAAYSWALRYHEYHEIEERYLDICKFLTVSKLNSGEKLIGDELDDNDADYVRKWVREGCRGGCPSSEA